MSAPRSSLREISAARLALFLNIPTLLLVAFVLFLPIIYALYLSLTRVSMIDLRHGFPFPFVYLQNYERIFQDPLFLTSLANTAAFSVFVVTVEVVAGLGIALLIANHDVWLSRVIRLLILLPYGVPPIANGLVWVYIYNSQSGFLNRVLYNAGLIDNYINWLGNPQTVIYLIGVPYIWRTLPFAVLLFHAALQSMPRDYSEAAQMDGAGYWRIFFSITLPLLRPVLAIVIILRTTFAFLVFDEVLATTQGGPGDASWVVSWDAYKRSFDAPFAIGAGSAASFVVALILIALALIYVKIIYRRVQL